MRYLLTFLVLFLAISCTPEKKGDPTRFVHGTFEIPAGDSYGKTTIVRKDSIQIEEYTKKVSISTDSLVTEKEIKHVDTLYIKWKNNFAYTLRMKSPKTDLDKDPIFVQITKVTDSSYTFTARIGYSNFKQEGTVYKVN
ncbi:hypothetical protein C8N26_1336 [Tenacibaculum lutimaris]|uniref:Uncharacterized protein n=1 Tax=Tenacibaculum lutimaris TaxID=285258 RepID=A0A420E0V6_9FLAO|nr:hypothetical protein [Tenacibaculum lutimaris]RKF03710.1 hypothetical protein C8N26_1336 [Tenacibaculum lutimaris]